MEKMVTVLTTAYNHEKYIGETLENIINQKVDFSFEVLVHDDASTDNTAEIIRRYVEKYPDIIIPIYQKENQYSKGKYPYDCFKPFIRGKYIALCEGDDFWCDENKLQKQVNYMENHPECVYCFCNSYKVDLESKIIGKQTPVDKSRVFSSREIIAAPEIFMATAGVLYLHEAAKDFSTAMMAGEAGDIPLRNYLMLKGNAYGLEERMCCYRVMTPGSWSDRFQKEMRNNIPQFLYKNNLYIQYYKNFDRITNGYYHEELQKHINQRLYLEYSVKADWKKLNQPPIKQIFKTCPRKFKIIIFIKYYFPVPVKIYRFLRYGKRGLEKKY